MSVVFWEWAVMFVKIGFVFGGIALYLLLMCAVTSKD